MKKNRTVGAVPDPAAANIPLEHKRSPSQGSFSSSGLHAGREPTTRKDYSVEAKVFCRHTSSGNILPFNGYRQRALSSRLSFMLDGELGAAKGYSIRFNCF